MKSPKAWNHPVHSELIAFTLAISMLALVGCRSSQPTAGGLPGSSRMGGSLEDDYTFGQPLPERGNFNPMADVSYREFTGGAMTTNVTPSSDEHTGTDAGKIYFATNSNVILPSQRPKLDKVAAWMRSNPTRSILIAGHCDERGTLEYNRALGERRAIAVRDYLIGLGISGERLHTFSFGEEKPAVAGTGPAVWAQNRRAEIGVIND